MTNKAMKDSPWKWLHGTNSIVTNKQLFIVGLMEPLWSQPCQTLFCIKHWPDIPEPSLAGLEESFHGSGYSSQEPKMQRKPLSDGLSKQDCDKPFQRQYTVWILGPCHFPYHISQPHSTWKSSLLSLSMSWKPSVGEARQGCPAPAQVTMDVATEQLAEML